MGSVRTDGGFEVGKGACHSACSVSGSEHLNVQEGAGKLEGAGAHCYLWIESWNCLGWKTPSRSSSPINSSPTVSKGNAKLEWDDKYFRGRKEKEIVPG